ncbi:MAG: YjjG family noncanonical pyrimidine nucleotidase [Muribaculaceae bacterium]|nr:YjjG family noncanonical pyrimidine nucleotidase [Muribaculaceae bacterium]
MKWIFFDLDDTLWNFSANSAVALGKLYEISPILRKLFKDLAEFREIYHANNSLLWDLYARGKVSTRDLKVERWRRTLATRQFEVLTAVCEELDRTYLDILAEGEEKFPGMEEMLQRLSKKALIAILSNGFSKTQYKKLQFSGLWRYVARTIVSEEIGINKPNPKLFEYAIQETGATPPFIMVGDHADTDILGAMKAGWHAIWFNPSGKPFPFTPEDLEKQGVCPSLYLGSASTPDQIESLIPSI